MKVGPRELLMFLLVLTVPVLSYLFVFKPQNEKMQTIRAEVAHKREMLEKLQSETAGNADLARANESIRSRLDSIEARLPTNKEIDDILRQVSDLAVESGMSPPVLESEKPVKAALYMEQPLTLKTKGPFNGYYAFLQSLERLPRITRVPDMTLQRGDRDRERMDVEFTLSIYFQDESGS